MKQHFLPEETLKKLEPKDMGLVYTSLQRLELKGEPQMVQSGSEEVCLVIIEGELDWKFEDRNSHAVMRDMLYIPIDSEIMLSGANAVVIRYGAPCVRKTAFGHIEFAKADKDYRHKVYGKTELGTRRDVWNCLDEKFDSSRFLMGICHGSDGEWTAWPPHEHGAQREEVYIYFDMKDGFGIQCVYTDKQKPDEVAIVTDGHLVTIPQGYHPNVGCPKGGISYVYCMVSVEAEQRRFMDLKTEVIYGDKLE
jgi:5-deoxy-glucuronate isomerase